MRFLNKGDLVSLAPRRSEGESRRRAPLPIPLPGPANRVHRRRSHDVAILLAIGKAAGGGPHAFQIDAPGIVLGIVNCLGDLARR